MKRLAWLGLAALSIGCSAGSVETAKQSDAPTGGEVVLAKFNADGAPTVAFDVPDMHCESCVAHVEGILGEQPGVKDVEVDLDSKVATVAVDEQAFDADKAVAALVDMQFDNAKLKTADTAAGAAEADDHESAPAAAEPADAQQDAAKS